MKFKSILLSVTWWLLSIFLIFFGVFGSSAVGYISIPIFVIGIIINPIFSKLLKKMFYFETKDWMKAIALAIAIIIFAMIKFKIISIPYNKNTDDTTTATSISMESSTAAY